MTATVPALSIEALEAGYEPGLSIVRGASLTMQAGEIVAIIGPNGAGKSSLVKTVAGLVPITAGRNLLFGKDITKTPAHRMVFEGLAFVPQTENVFVNLSVSENLELAARLRSAVERTPWSARDPLVALRSFGRGMPRCILDPIYAMFPDLHRQRSDLAGRLSGGQRQMLAIARGLIAQPKLLILDEPSAGLSPKLADQVFTKLREVRDTGVTVLLVEQNVKAALALADRVAVMVEGKERIVAPSADLLNDNRIAELYLGRRTAKERT